MSNAAIDISTPYDVVCGTEDEAAWLEARRSGIGASEIPIVLGCAPKSWGGELELYAHKVEAIPSKDLDDVEAIRWGKLLEPVIIAEYEVRTGRKVYPGGRLLRSKEHRWALATLDAWTGDPGQPEMWPLQVKNVTEWKGEDWIDGPPDYYVAQVHQEMLVTGARRATVAALLGGNRLIWCDVERDERLTRKIAYHGALFWERLAQRVPPDPDGSESARNVLHTLFPHDDGTEVELPMALAEVVDEWQQMKREAKALEERIRQAENSIKATLGTATRGFFPGGDAISWKEQSMPERVMAATSFRVLRYHPNKRK